MADEDSARNADRQSEGAKMAAHWANKMDQELEAAHAAVPALPILERLEAEMGADLVAESQDAVPDTQHSPVIPCGQPASRPSSVHVDDGPPVVVDIQSVSAGGGVHSPAENVSASQSSGSVDKSVSPPAKVSKVTPKSTPKSSRSRKTSQTGKKPRETAAHKTEIIKQQVTQNQQELEKVCRWPEYSCKFLTFCSLIIKILEQCE